MNRLNKTAIVAFMFLSLLGPAYDARPQAPQPAQGRAQAKASKFYRTELYFGRSKPDGGSVSDVEWKRFLAETVTPRFPDGFTALSGVGQYREKSGRVISEQSEVLIFYYSSNAKKESRTKIDEIRSAYIKAFQQESVLRVDLPKSVRVSF